MKSVSRIVWIECFRPSVASLFDFDSDLSFLVNIVSETIWPTAATIVSRDFLAILCESDEKVPSAFYDWYGSEHIGLLL